MRRENEHITNNEIVSVIVPVYQAEKYIERCVNSLIHQTYHNLEIILIDDGSKDNSFNICKRLAEDDTRIKVFHNENQGVASTRNQGLDYAGGQYIYFLDSDDWIVKDAISEMVAALKMYESDLCICGFNIFFDDKSMKEFYPDIDGLFDKNDFMIWYFWILYEKTILFNIGTKLYKRNIIEKNNLRFCTDMTVYEDIRFCLEYMEKCQKLYVCNKPYYYYFQGNNKSVTHSYDKNFWNNTVLYCNLLVNEFNTDSEPLKKAVTLCLYRAYLQECRKAHREKAVFYKEMEIYCLPIIQRINLKKQTLSGLSVDQKIFGELILNKAWFALWLLTFLVSFKNMFRGKLC